MNQAAKAQEPSMEEILTSIRRIIADDDAGKAAPGAPAADGKEDDVEAMLDGPDGEAQKPPAADVLELTESMQAKPAFQAVGPVDVAFGDSPEPDALPRETERPEPLPPEPARSAPPPDRALLSPRTAAAVDTAFNTLAHTVLVQNSRTLEDLVREMLKPMLKAWLDDNLPNMVERLVRAEIERVSRGRG